MGRARWYLNYYSVNKPPYGTKNINNNNNNNNNNNRFQENHPGQLGFCNWPADGSTTE